MDYKRNYNGRTGEEGNPFAYQITFRTTRALSGEFASCKGLIKHSGIKMTLIDMFEKIFMPALRSYVAPLAALRSYVSPFAAAQSPKRIEAPMSMRVYAFAPKEYELLYRAYYSLSIGKASGENPTELACEIKHLLDIIAEGAKQ